MGKNSFKDDFERQQVARKKKLKIRQVLRFLQKRTTKNQKLLCMNLRLMIRPLKAIFIRRKTRYRLWHFLSVFTQMRQQKKIRDIRMEKQHFLKMHKAIDNKHSVIQLRDKRLLSYNFFSFFFIALENRDQELLRMIKAAATAI